MIYVLTRTAGRPKFFEKCAQSVFDQSYPDVVHVIGYESDDAATRAYIDKSTHLREPILVGYPAGSPDSDGQIFYNRYFTDIYKRLEHLGAENWITYLDDDDVFQDEHALQALQDAVKPPTRMVIGRADWNGIFPAHDQMGVRPHYNSIATSGWMFRASLLPYAHWRTDIHSNWVVAQNIYDQLEPWEVEWVDKVLARMQRPDGSGGHGARDDAGAAGAPDHTGLDDTVYTPHTDTTSDTLEGR